MVACIAAVLHFKESKNMEAAFGLSVTITMLITTFLITAFMITRRKPLLLILLTAALFLTVESSFLIANIQKLKEGGWIMLVVGGILTGIMLIWYKGKAMQQGLVKHTQLNPQLVNSLVDLSHNPGINHYASNLIYLTSVGRSGEIETKVLNSILNAPAKKADVYWFFHVHFTDEPYTMEYEVYTISKNDVYQVTVHLGFRVEARLDLFFREIAEALLQSGELTFENHPQRQYAANNIGDYKFVVTNSFLSYDNKLPFWRNIYIRLYYTLKSIGVREDENYGLDSSNVVFEKYPLVYSQVDKVHLRRRESK